MKNIVYHIEKDIHYNEYGTPSEPTFFIKYEHTFLLLFKEWKYVTYKRSGFYDSYAYPYQFDSVASAQSFIDNILCKGIPRQRIVSEIVDTVTCK